MTYRQDGKYGAISLDGKTIIPAEYDNVTLKKGAYLRVVKDGKMTFINAKNELLLPLIFERVEQMDNYLTVRYEGFEGTIRNDLGN